MSIVKLENSILRGEVTAPPSKSVTHRALICSFLAGGGVVNNESYSNDIQATKQVISALGSGSEELNCLESAGTLRFLIPVAAALGKSVTFVGSERLAQRPLKEYLCLLEKHGVRCESEKGLPLRISGRLTPGRFELPGNVSSQYITGLLLALPVLNGNSEIVLTTELQSAPYVDLTLRVMKDYGVEAVKTENGWRVEGNQVYRLRDYYVEGDWSQAAFFLAGGVISGDVTVKGVDVNSPQGDKEIINILKRFGAEIETGKDYIKAKKSKLRGTELDASDFPDLVPALAAVAAYADGKTLIKGVQRLKYKESDRIESVTQNLRKMGINAVEAPDGMVITGGRPHGAELLGYNDHRIVMAFSVAALKADGETYISDSESINKSYPEFFDDFNSLGGKANVICNR